MLILDLGLPDMDGLTLLKKIRQMKVNMPVLILTAREPIEDKIKGLDQGADDSTSKPFDVNELHCTFGGWIERRLAQQPVLLLLLAK